MSMDSADKTAFADYQPIGQRLLSQGHIQARDLERALAFQKEVGGRLGSVLVRLGALSEDVLLTVLSEQLDMPVLEAPDLPPDQGVFRTLAEESGLPVAWFLNHGVICWRDEESETVSCIARDPLDHTVREVLDRTFGEQRLAWWLCRSQHLDRLLNILERTQTRSRDADDVNQLREMAEEAPVIELVNNLFSQAMDRDASDIHVEPEEHQFHVRFRVDGVLHTELSLPRERYDAVASRVKLVGGMDIAERRLPQDGRTSMRVSGQEVDVRISSVPGVFGESIVMRLLPKENRQLDLDQLGFERDHYRLFLKWARSPHGIVLVTGPTGSGKSTTLYGTLDAINERDRKIITVEDPVEYHLNGVTQIQTHSEIGYTFGRALRAILRQDPDILMIGEVRDLETAQIAVQASLTGHLVFSTLHTNDAVSAFTRLADMGVEPFLVGTSVLAVQAQRLVRRVCPECAHPNEPIPEIREIAEHAAARGGIDLGPQRWVTAEGCHHCRGSGYRGRMGIYELVDVSPEIQRLIMKNASEADIWEMARQQGARDLREDGLIKAARGATTVEEVVRVTGGTLDDSAQDGDPAA